MAEQVTIGNASVGSNQVLALNEAQKASHGVETELHWHCTLVVELNLINFVRVCPQEIRQGVKIVHEAAHDRVRFALSVQQMDHRFIEVIVDPTVANEKCVIDSRGNLQLLEAGIELLEQVLDSGTVFVEELRFQRVVAVDARDLVVAAQQCHELRARKRDLQEQSEDLYAEAATVHVVSIEQVAHIIGARVASLAEYVL